LYRWGVRNERLADAPHHEPDDQKVQNDAGEIPNPEFERADIERGLLPRAAGHRCRYYRHDEVVYNGLHHFAECGPHYHRQSECENVLLEYECLEFAQHCLIP